MERLNVTDFVPKGRECDTPEGIHPELLKGIRLHVCVMCVLRSVSPALGLTKSGTDSSIGWD